MSSSSSWFESATIAATRSQDSQPIAEACETTASSHADDVAPEHTSQLLGERSDGVCDGLVYATLVEICEDRKVRMKGGSGRGGSGGGSQSTPTTGREFNCSSPMVEGLKRTSGTVNLSLFI